MTTKHSSSPTFIFLEFLDPEINALLRSLMQMFSGSASKKNIHITVRGPFYKRTSSRELDRFSILLQHEPILIHGVGIFENEKENVVYIKVSHKNLRKIWDKPDYPINLFGFNPHISIYRGADKRLAKLIYDFIKNEQLTLLCHNFRLTTYISKQLNLFPKEESSIMFDFSELCKRRNIQPNLLGRAKCLIDKYYSHSHE